MEWFKSLACIVLGFGISIVGGLIGYWLISSAIKATGSILKNKFIGMGTLKGKSKSEIVAVVGAPNSTASIAGGKTLCQWMATSYHIALLFNDEICEGVTSETKI